MEDIFGFSDWAVSPVEENEIYCDYMLSDIAGHLGLSVVSVSFRLAHEPVDIPSVANLRAARSCWIADVLLSDNYGQRQLLSIRPLFWRNVEDEFPVQGMKYSDLRVRRFRMSYTGKKLPVVWCCWGRDGSLLSSGDEILSFSSLEL